jgi:hypothetical protein
MEDTMSCVHRWTTYQAEGLTFNARCATCGELAFAVAMVTPEESLVKEVLEAAYGQLVEIDGQLVEIDGQLVEIDGQLVEIDEEEQAERPSAEDQVVNFEDGIADGEQAERYLEWLRYRNGKIDEISQRMDAEIKRLEDRKGQLLSGHRQRAEYLEAALKKYLWESGQKRIDYAYGTLTRRRGRERVEVEDEYAFCVKHGDDDALVATTRRPDKLGIKAHIKSTGEIPDGADLVRGDDTCTITLTTGAAP